MSNHNRILFPFFIILFLISNLSVAQPVKLRLNLSDGTSYKVLSVMENDITQTIMGVEQSTTQKYEFVYIYDVTDVESNGDMAMNLIFESVKASVQTPQGSEEYDSEDENSSPGMQTMAYAAMDDQQLQMVMTDRGEINEIGGIDKLLDNMLDMYNVNDPAQRQQVRATLENQISDESLKSQMTGISVVFPEKAVSVGDGWATTTQSQMSFPMMINSSYTIKSITDKSVEIAVNASVKTLDGEPMSMQGMEMVVSLEGTQSGVLVIDRDTGWTISSTITQEIGGSMEILPNAQIPDGMELPMNIRNTMTSEWID